MLVDVVGREGFWLYDECVVCETLSTGTPLQIPSVAAVNSKDLRIGGKGCLSKVLKRSFVKRNEEVSDAEIYCRHSRV